MSVLARNSIRLLATIQRKHTEIGTEIENESVACLAAQSNRTS